jgi:hypothetical protein
MTGPFSINNRQQVSSGYGEKNFLGGSVSYPTHHVRDGKQ